MMSEQRESYVRGYFEWATLFAVAGWVGLWMLWPAAGNRNIELPKVRAPAVLYARLQSGSERDYLNPTIMARPTTLGAVPGSTERRKALVGSGVSTKTAAPALLDWKTSTGPERPWDAPATLSEEAARQLTGYRPEWRDEPVFTNRTSAMTMTIVCGDRLKQNGFQLPEFPPQMIKQFDKPWQMVLYVEMNEQGKPRFVLVDKSSEDQKIDSAVARIVYRSRLEKTGKACSGRVNLNYGLQ
jgi:hypothetical protein